MTKKHPWGFTLVELLVVLGIIALTISAVSLSIGDTRQQLLEKDVQQLQAQLEKARAIARTSEQTWYWQAVPGGYKISSTAAAASSPEVRINWRLPQTQILPSEPIVILGPEPVIPPARLTLSLSDQPQIRISLQTDGASGFEVVP
jgi:general secretion pathway protein H